ncbi:IS3 family transposase [Vagococcus carniphilus]|uniref:IS3 family transposase n=1 Tax=Vagococcus carniphilus TaxID=218144 RepID=UPI000F87E41B|nr:IS3 family transposase [Vagococcus carniphilus]QNN72541.1 IS3 family transposase [Vagococcus carniphilus]
MATNRKPRRTFKESFKKQMVELHRSGKPRKDILREYDLTPSTFDKWVKQYNQSGSFKEKDNLTPEEKELRELRKLNKELMMENDILKQAALIFGRKLEVVRKNKDKYSVSAMCRKLEVSRGAYYYEIKKKELEAVVEKAIIDSFTSSRNSYGSRRIKDDLKDQGLIVSRRRIRRVMLKFNFVSSYTTLKFKPLAASKNEQKIENVLSREFDRNEPMEALVTDLTYVKVGNKWHYVCFIIDLFNREIVGYSSGPNKSVDLVLQALATINSSLESVQFFHTDRGKEFDNQSIDELLDAFQIKRSLSRPGCPYDNAVAEATYRAFKIEFIYQQSFDSLFELQYELMDYVNWWNKFRKHGKLGYLSPLNYRLDWKMKQAV